MPIENQSILKKNSEKLKKKIDGESAQICRLAKYDSQIKDCPSMT